MNPKETLVFDGRSVYLEWIESDSIPDNAPISQVTGFCVNENREILIIKNKRGWGFPGGHPEVNESPIDTLHREIAEEAYVTVSDPKPVGYMEVNDPDNSSIEGKHYIQLRYLAKVKEVKDFKKEFETSERKFVPLDSLPEYISWISSPTGSGQIVSLRKKI